MVIDLGEPRDEVEMAPRPWSPRQRRAVAVLLAVAALMGAGGAAAPGRPALVSVTIQATAADEVLVEGDALYLLRPSRGVSRSGLRTITRYRLPDATTPEWEARFYTDGPVRGASLVDGMLLAVADGRNVQTVAIQPETGKEVWRRSGWYHRTAPGHGLLQDHSRVVTQRLFSVDLASGNVRWSREYPADDQVLIDRDRFVRWSQSDTAELYDAESGALLATAQLPFDRQLSVQVAAGLLLVPGESDGRPVITAYGRDRLDRRWQAEIDVRSEYLGGECGDALCVGNANDSGVRLVDLATGHTRWSAPGWGYTSRVGPYLLAYGPGESTNPRAALLDPADGHIVGDLGEWSASLPAPDGRMLGIRENGTRTLVARLDPLAVEVEVLGLLADVFQCQSSPAAVVCRRAGGSIGVWYPERKL
jgi:outer membrane protein assembly factor BamB